MIYVLSLPPGANYWHRALIRGVSQTGRTQGSLLRGDDPQVAIFLETLEGVLDAEAGALVSTEGDIRRQDEVLVDPGGSRFHPAGNRVEQFRILPPNGAA